MANVAKKLMCVLAIAVFAGSAAFAQDQAPLVTALFEPAFERRSDAGAPERLIPREAMQRSQAGAAIICCRPRADRTMYCETVWEAPIGFGFGRLATRFVMAQQQLTEASHAEYVARSDPRAFPQLMRFQFEGATAAPSLPPREDRQALCDAAMPVEN